MTPTATAAAPARTPLERPRRPAGTRPRRVSGPARSPAHSERARVADRRAGGLGGALVLAAVGVYEHRLLDRVVRGRVWIGLVTFALLGIVTLQLGLLQLNGSIGRELQRRAQLLRENSALSIENSSLASDEHVMSAAAQAGMVPISIKALRFLNAHGASTARAVEVLRAPVQPASSESSAASSGGEASSSGEASSGGEASSSGEASAGSEGSASAGSQAQQPEQSAQSSGAAASGPASSESGPAEAAVSEAGGSSSSAGGGG